VTESKPTVSVIIPTYNRAGMVGAAIDSLLAQTRRLAQIIVVDDGSMDATSEVLSQYANRITVVTQENRGRSAARNAGLALATSDYVCFLDSDDQLPPQSIELRALVLDHNASIDVVYGDALVKDMTTGRQITFSRLHREPRPSGNIFASLALGNIAPIHCFMFRRGCLSSVGGFDESLDTLEDYDFWLKMAPFAMFAYIDAPVATYIVHSKMTTLTMPDRMRQGRLEVLSRVVRNPAFNALTTTRQGTVYSRLGATCLALGKAEEARKWLGKSLRTSPTPQRLMLYLLTLVSPRITKSIIGLRRKLRVIAHPKTRIFHG